MFPREGEYAILISSFAFVKKFGSIMPGQGSD